MCSSEQQTDGVPVRFGQTLSRWFPWCTSGAGHPAARRRSPLLFLQEFTAAVQVGDWTWIGMRFSYRITVP
jgi:hypothetical protein